MSNETNISVKDILPNPYQPASRLKPAKEVVDKIAASILEHGLLQTPIVRLVNGKYEMGDGWQRLCAFRQLKKEYIPVLIRELTDRQMADLIVEANMVRFDLTVIDLAKFYSQYLKDFKITQAELAKIHNVSQGEVANTIRLLELPAEIQAKVISQEISETHARTMLQLGEKVNDKGLIKELVENITDRNYSVSSLDHQIKSKLYDSTKPLYPGNSWDTDRMLFNVDGCKDCQHNVMLSPPWDKEKRRRCNDSKCWLAKNREIKAKQDEKDLKKLKDQGISKIVHATGNMPRFYDRVPAACQKCNKKVASKNRYSNSDKFEIYCSDRKCFDSKESAKREADKHAQEVEARKQQEAIVEIFDALPAGEIETLKVTIECMIGHGQQDYLLRFGEAFDVLDKTIKPAQNIWNDKRLLPEKLMAQIDAKVDNLQAKDVVAAANLLLRMIVRLSFEWRSDNRNEKETKELLAKFKAAAGISPILGIRQPKKKEAAK